MSRTLIIVLAWIFAGCANTRSTARIVAVKETIWGVKVGASPAGGTPSFQIGLVRTFWQEIPVATNAVWAPDWRADVEADVKLQHQIVDEHFGAGRGATNRP
jgi:hypothetical protein